MRKLKPLSQEASELLRHERKVEPVPQEVRRRVLARARFSLRMGSAPATRRRASLRYLVTGAVGLGFATFAFAAIRQQLREPIEKDVAPSVTMVNTAVEIATTPSEPRLLPQGPANPVDGAPKTSAANVKPAPALGLQTNSRASVPGDQLDRELALLKRARAAVAEGDSQAAIAAISEHMLQFPGGRLREEREALRVTALWNAGKHAAARRAAARFNKLFPRSVLSAQMAAKAKAEQ